MKVRFGVGIGVILAATVAAVLTLIVRGHTFVVFSAAGPVAERERTLIIVALALSLLVVVPVFVLTAVIAYKYRATNPHATYTPDWDHSRLHETIWWTLPTLLMVVISVISWRATHQLDPAKPLASAVAPLTVEVVALDWKWLFIYPEQGIATVNTLELPVGRPVNFLVTADAPMNSFWIPRLGGQIYAMPGMSTRLSLMAARPGNYDGVSANVSGVGFAGMRFTAHAVSQADFVTWANSAVQSPSRLTLARYNELARPTQNVPPASYSLAETDLYNEVVMQYMMPGMKLTDLAEARP